MVDFSEDSVFPQSIAIIEETDLVLGGSESNGPNRLAKPLVDRTRWLLDKVTELEATIDGTALLDRFHPVGSYYFNESDSRNPSEFMGGTWTAVEGRMFIGVDSNPASRFNSVGSTGGEVTVGLSVGNLPAHTHGVSQTAHDHGYDENNPETNGGTAGYTTGNDDARRVSRRTSFESANISIDSTGSNVQHENMPPYIVGYMWKRVS